MHERFHFDAQFFLTRIKGVYIIVKENVLKILKTRKSRRLTVLPHVQVFLRNLRVCHI